MPGFTLHSRDKRGLVRWVMAWVLAAGWLASGAATAQALPLRYHLQSDGLSNLVITALVQHPDGRLWIGTENGLYRHDGTRIERVDTADAAMRSRQINAVVSDAQGGLWVGTGEALFHWSEDGLVPVSGGAAGISVRQGQTIAVTADGMALVASDAGLLAMRRDAAGVWRASPALPEAVVRNEPLLASIHSVLVDADGTWWLGCGGSLCRWKAGVLAPWGERQGVSKARWAGLLRASDGALWVRSQTQVLRWAAEAAGFEDITPPDLSHGTVHRQQPLVEDSDGRVMTQSDSGLLRWAAGRWTHFGAANGLMGGGGVHAILVDRDRDVWLGTAGHGLAHWRGYRHWRNWTSAQGLPSDDVWGFMDEAPGVLWIGTGSGAVMLDQGRDDAARFTKSGGTSHQVGSIARDAAGLRWMSTYSGELFYRRDGSPWQRAATRMPLIFKLLPATDGGLWIGTYAGLYRMEPGSARQAGAAPPHKVDLKMKESPAVYAACTSPNGQAWFGSSKGLLMYDAARGLTQPAIQGLPKDLSVEKVVCGSDGTLWVAGAQSNQLWRLRGSPEGWQAEAVNPQILGRRNVMGLLVDRRAWLWVTTDDGVVVWNGQQWRRFDESNGLVWSDCNQNALHEDAEGSIWIGTSRGVSQVLRPELLFAPAPLELHITRVQHEGRARPIGQPWTARQSTAPLEIEWTVPAFANRPAQRVLYRLPGLSDQWNTTQHDNISFAALPAGAYTFEAVAQNLDTGQKSAPVFIGFEILPPWWLTPWLVASYVLMAAMLVVLAYRWRVRLLMRRQRELEGLVSSRTAELELSYERMRTLALTDGLTGAMNRRAIMELAGRELARARRGEVPVAFVLLDVDHFKRINDTHGHLAGDAVLKQLVERLHGVMRPYDAFGRYGGEEFLLVLPGLSLAAEEGLRRVEAIQRNIAQQPFDIGNGQVMTVTCSAGAVGAPVGETVGLEALIDRADAALYKAKRDGRNRVALAR